MITPKQEDIYKFIKRFGNKGDLSSMDIGLGLDIPRKKAERWANPALRGLTKLKLIERIGDVYKIKKQE